MIRFSLSCKRDHKFEGWFAGNADYEKQNAAGLIACPVCGSAHIVKTLMTPHLAGKAGGEAQASGAFAGLAERGAAKGSPLEEGVPQAGGLRRGEEALQKLLLLRKMQRRKLEVLHKLQLLARKMRENAENVGEKFAEEARKIHFGEAKSRSIYGKADAKEVHSLLEDGIDVMPLPRLPEDAN